MYLGTRLTSHTLKVDEESLVSQQANEIIMDLKVKLSAEDARLRRLLPDPPPGFRWVYELQSHVDRDPFRDNEVQYRIIYKLQEF
jgi:hypothetical protein